MGTTLNDSLHIFHFKCPSPSTRFLIGNQTCCKCSKTLCGSLFTKHIRDACIKVYKTSEKRERNLHRLVQPYLHPHEELERNIIINLDDIRAITHTQFSFLQYKYYIEHTPHYKWNPYNDEIHQSLMSNTVLGLIFKEMNCHHCTLLFS